MNPESAPIALFAYNRPRHFSRALAALAANAPASASALHVFSDGPRDGESGDLVAQVRELARGATGFQSVTLHEQPRNLGLAASVISGVDLLCRRHGRLIVVEDDLVVGPGFLGYMNDALRRFEAEEKVMQVSGYMFPVDMDCPVDSLFLPFTTSWGWATWDRAWRKFDPGMAGLARLSDESALRRRFNLGGAYDYYSMLLRQQRGEVDSWAIRWYLSVFLQEGLVLYPARSLVSNTGFDGSGTHGSGGFREQARMEPHFVETFPDSVSLYGKWQRVLAGLPGNGSGLRRLASRARAAARKAFASRSSA